MADARGNLAIALRRARLTREREKDFDFYWGAYLADELNYRDIRKRGRHLSAEEKRERNIAFRGIISAEFLDTLNSAGLADPLLAADVITALARNFCHNAGHLWQLAAVGLLAKFRMSNMAAGPCDRAQAFNNELFDPEVAPVPPLEDCPHPAQCACMYQGDLDLPDDS